MNPVELEQIWQTTLGQMEVQLSRANFATWLKSSRLVDSRDGCFFISLPNNFAREWVENKYHKSLLGIIRTINPSVKKLEFVVASQAPSITDRRPKEEAVQATMQGFGLDLRVDPETNLNPRYTLDSFIVGGSNELAHAAVTGIVESIGTKYNPFFIYGGVGLGKTHLIQGAGNEIVRRYKGAVRPRYVSSEKFTSDIVWAIKNKRMEDMKKKYRDVDVLIIDDIQFIGGKEKTQEEFFHTFNSLYEHNKQIIISSDRPPQSIPTLEERLRSRFEGGLIADVGYPEYEMRLAIIKSKLQEFGREMDPAIIDLIARRVRKNIRELEGVLKKVLFYQDKRGGEISERAAAEVIDSSIQNSSKHITDSQIIKAVAEFFSVQLEELTGRCRKKEIVEPRQIAMFLLRDILNTSYPYIGERFGRDHTTAIHAYEKINTEINKNSSLNQKIILIRDLISKIHPQ